jgi:hypothetical protein
MTSDANRNGTPKRSGTQSAGQLASVFEDLDRQWPRLRAATPPADLWDRIERRAASLHVRRSSSPAARAAAAIAGFLGVAIGASALEQRLETRFETAAGPPAHLFQLGNALSSSESGLSFLVSIPEYRLLRTTHLITDTATEPAAEQPR